MKPFILFVATLATLTFGRVSAGEARFQNIVYILADDLGYGDVRCYNLESKIQTDSIVAQHGQSFGINDLPVISAG